MKTIFILSDSFRRDHLGAHGAGRAWTPNLDRLAGRSCLFERMYVGSFPTGPNRRDLHVGTGTEPGRPFNPWKNIEPHETTLAQRLADEGIASMMITDVANCVTRGANLFQGFGGYLVNRGQEGDPYFLDDSVPLELPVPPELIRYPAEMYHRVLTNRARRQVEDDWFAPGTFKLACQWLERNWRREDFLLWIETFDPHEPWDPPAWYVDRYDPGYDGRVIECPPYGLAEKLGITPRESRHIQARYAGEVTMVDFAVGRLLATLDRLGLTDEVAIVFTSDHGLYTNLPGDAGMVGKPWKIGRRGAWLIEGDFSEPAETRLPLRTGICRIPLMIHLPGQTTGRRIQQIAQPWDIQPTLLEMFGRPIPDGLIGRSLLPLTEGKALPDRPAAFTGIGWEDTPLAQATTDRWLYATWPGTGDPPWLIDLASDPSQTTNAAARHPDVCAHLHDALAEFDPARFAGV